MGEASPGDSAEVASLKAELRKAHRHDAAKDRVLRSSQTLMALQGRHLGTLSKHLAEKTRKRNDIKRVLFKSGDGVLVTSDQSMALVRDAEERRAKASRARDERKAQRVVRKKVSDDEKAHRKAIREKFREDLRRWEEECAAIRAANPNKHRNLGLPPRPRNPLYAHRRKSVAVSESEGEDEETFESEESDADNMSDADPMDIDLVHTDDDDMDWEDE